MAHTFINISFEDASGTTLTATVDGDIFTPDGWAIITNTNSVEETADFGASAGDFIERAERFEAHWTGLSTYVEAYEEPVNPAELEFAQFHTGIDAEAFEDFEREWSTNEDYLFGLGATAIAQFDPGGTENFEDYEEEWSDNGNYFFALGPTDAADFDPVTGTEPFEDYEDEWSDNHNYAFNIGGITTDTAVFDIGGGGENFEDFEETDLTQWLVQVVLAVGAADYICTIDGEDMIHTAIFGPSVTSIRDGLITAIGLGSKPVVTTIAGADSFTLERDPAIQVPARNTPLGLAVSASNATGDLIKLPRDKTSNWTQTGQMATDP